MIAMIATHTKQGQSKTREKQEQKTVATAEAAQNLRAQFFAQRYKTKACDTPSKHDKTQYIQTHPHHTYLINASTYNAHNFLVFCIKKLTTPSKKNRPPCALY
jgi:hypothetical protein